MTSAAPATPPDPSRWSRPSSPVPAEPQHHSTYYMDDPMTIFLVEGRLIRVHRYLLERESGFFRDMFSLPQPDRQQEGLVDDKPIRLGEIMGVSLREVESLLRFMYQRPTNGRHKASLEEWKALLRIATLLDCQDIREHAIWEISRDKSVTAIQTIILGHKYEVVKWLWVGYRALCMRDPPLTLPEAQELGLEETVRVSEGREKFIKSSRRVWGSEEAMNQVMLEVFGLSVSGNEVNA